MSTKTETASDRVETLPPTTATDLGVAIAMLDALGAGPLDIDTLTKVTRPPRGEGRSWDRAWAHVTTTQLVTYSGQAETGRSSTPTFALTDAGRTVLDAYRAEVGS